VPHPETQDGVGVEYYDDVIDRERLKASKGLVRIPRYFASEKDAKNFAAVLGAARPRA
jgi:hypothetical protein